MKEGWGQPHLRVNWSLSGCDPSTGARWFPRLCFHQRMLGRGFLNLFGYGRKNWPTVRDWRSQEKMCLSNHLIWYKEKPPIFWTVLIQPLSVFPVNWLSLTLYPKGLANAKYLLIFLKSQSNKKKTLNNNDFGNHGPVILFWKPQSSRLCFEAMYSFMSFSYVTL